MQASISWSPVLICLLTTSLAQVVCYYTSSLALQKVDALRLGRASSLASLLSALLVAALLWYLDEPGEHGLTAGVLIGALLLVAATVMLTHPQRHAQTSLVGYSASGLPLYSSQRSPSPVMAWLGPTLSQILDNNDSRRIFYFLLLNVVRRPCLFPPPSLSTSPCSDVLSLPVSTGLHVHRAGLWCLDKQPGADLRWLPHAL